MEYKECYQKIYASWLGKLIGIRLGAPIENWLGKDVRKMYHPIRNYTVDYGQFAADDDANGPLFFVSVMEKYNLDTITVKAMGEHLLNVVGNHTGFFWWGGKGVASEETAWQNLMDGIEAPESGSIKTNGKALAEQIGGQIFSDCWGYITLGRIEDAVRLSSMMASVTHDGEAIEGAKFVAACIAAAWNKKDIRDVIDTAKTYLNKESSYYALIEEIEDYYDSNPEDSDKCLAYIEGKYDYKNFEGVCHILPNTAIMLYGMLYGKNSFDETMRLIAEAGRDTDCNLGNVGSIMGIMLGLEGISEKWITPFNDILLSSSSIGSRNITTISESTKYFTDLASKLYSVPTDTDTNGYDFSLPYATHGFYVSSNRYACASLRTHDNKLQINLDTLKKGKKVYLELKTYYQSKDVYDCRYQPQYTPLYEKGDSIRLKFNNVENLPVVIHFSEMADNEKENDINLELDKEVTLSCNKQKNYHMITSLVFEITALEDITQSILELETFEIVKHPEIDYQFANFENEDWGYSFGGDHETRVKGITIYKGKAEVNNNALVLHAKSAINMSSIFARFKKLTYTLNKSDELNVTLGYDYQGCFSYKGIQLDSIQKKIYYIERETYTNIKKVEVGDLKELSGLVKVTLDINKQVMILNDESLDVSNIHAEGGALVIINDSDKDISLLSVTAGEIISN